MGSEPGIVEISSDEEEAADGKRSRSPLDWIVEFFDRADESDDVIVLEDKSSKPCAAAGAADDSDDDCLVLDGDPDGQMSAADGDKRGGGDASDELLIVGEKGQVACRDFPHPRHLCANFPFSSAPHEMYCGMCHCYVCDSPAPCQYWGNGMSSTDHCHSTDKETRWKNERKSFKQRNLPTPQPSKLPNASLPIIPPFLNPQPIHCNNPIIIPNPPSKSNPPRAHPATIIPVPAVTSQRYQQHRSIVSFQGQRLGRHPPKTHPLVPATQRVQKERCGSGALAAQIMNSHSKFKRIAIPGAFCVNLNSSRSQTAVSGHNQINGATAQLRPQCPPVTSAIDGMKFWQDVLAGVATELGVAEDTSKSTTYGQPYPVTSQPTMGLFHPQMMATQDHGLADKSSPALTNTKPSAFDSSWLNDTTAQNNLECEQSAQKLNCSVFESNLDPGDIVLETFMANLEQETALEPANKSGLLDMEPLSQLYDLDCTWSA